MKIIEEKEDKWKVEDAIRTLMEYQKIMKDEELKKKAVKELEKRSKEMKELSKNM